MYYIFVVAGVLMISIPAFAADSQPTVALTIDKLDRLIHAEVSHALRVDAEERERRDRNEASDVYDDIKNAFGLGLPKAPSPTPAPPTAPAPPQKSRGPQ